MWAIRNARSIFLRARVAPRHYQQYPTAAAGLVQVRSGSRSERSVAAAYGRSGGPFRGTNAPSLSEGLAAYGGAQLSQAPDLSGIQNQLNNISSTPVLRGGATSPPSGASLIGSQAPASNPARAVGEFYLPGLKNGGQTYLDPQFADRVAQFVSNAQALGITPSFASGYRTPAYQAKLADDPTATTPAKDSLHSTGNAFDIHSAKTMDPATLAHMVAAAARGGLSWGGNFAKPDPGHFYFDPGGNRQQAIQNFSAGVDTLQNKIPDR